MTRLFCWFILLVYSLDFISDLLAIVNLPSWRLRKLFCYKWKTRFFILGLLFS